MPRRYSSPAGSIVIALLAHCGFVAVVIALMIPVLLHYGERGVDQTVAQQLTAKRQVLHRGFPSPRTLKL